MLLHTDFASLMNYFIELYQIYGYCVENNMTSDDSNIWFFELNQEKLAIERIKEIVNSSEEFGDEDLIIFADIDEMISREVLHSLKHCQLRHGVLSGAIIMPMGNFDLAFRFILNKI